MPQHPRSAEDDAAFRAGLLKLNQVFGVSISGDDRFFLVINSHDYMQRACTVVSASVCVFDLI
jgi:hypothetical protein